ncbi:MAG: type II toxin-antitoxin system PemK/MazF family toxin [Acidobacteriota bacterium]
MDRVNRGDIWVVEPVGFPKPRPALVISINPINDLCPDVLLVPITTKPGPLRVPLTQPATMTGLKLRGFAKCESLGPVHKSRLKKRIGRIPSKELSEIETGLKKVLGLSS